MFGGSDHVGAVKDSINLSVKLIISIGNSPKRSGKPCDLPKSGDEGSSPSGIVFSNTSVSGAGMSTGDSRGLSVKSGFVLLGD